MLLTNAARDAMYYESTAVAIFRRFVASPDRKTAYSGSRLICAPSLRSSFSENFSATHSAKIFDKHQIRAQIVMQVRVL